MRRRAGEDGMVLVNVLMLVAVAAAVLAIMVAGDDAALQRATRMREAADAQQVALGGERAAVVALRRDMAVAPDGDDATEPWANIGVSGAAIAGGRFAQVVADATGRLDLNPLARGDPVTRGRLATAAAALGLGQGAAERIEATLIAAGPIADLADLAAAGLTPVELARLATVATVLPVPAAINLNAVPEPLLALLIDDAAAARGLIALRARRGRLTRDDFVTAQVALPPGCGFVSPFYWSVAETMIGGTRQRLTSLIERRMADGRAEAVAVARWRGAPPLQAPPLPQAAQAAQSWSG